MAYLFRCLWVLVVLVAVSHGHAQVPARQATSDWANLMSAGSREREQGRVDLAINHLQKARSLARGALQQMQSAGELGAALLQARRLDQAEAPLREARELAQDDGQRAAYTLALGNLANLRKDAFTANRHYYETQQLAGELSVESIKAGLNLARSGEPAERMDKLLALSGLIARSPAARAEASLHLNLGHQAQALGTPGLPLAHRSMEQARLMTSSQPATRLHLESLDGLAQLYEGQRRLPEAMRLTRLALDTLRRDALHTGADLQIAQEWRLARLYRLQGQEAQALAAYQRAVDQIELLRQDIPIDYDDGQSSYRSTLEPVYLGLVDSLLRSTDAQPVSQQQAILRRARDAVELIKQTELQDYLGDRCVVDAVKGGSLTVIPRGTAVLYPIQFADRLELLVETTEGLQRVTTVVPSATLQQAADSLAREVRSERGNYLADARKLHDWILKPLDALMARAGIDTLVVIPDATLRTVPIAALHDGNRFAIEKYAIAIATGLSMTNTNPAPRGAMSALVAGASRFGGVVDKMGTERIDAMMRSTTPVVAPGRMLRSARALTSTAAAPATPSARSDARGEVSRETLRESLALPGVTREVVALQGILNGTNLQDADFTLEAFRKATASAPYSVIHVASHGIFGGTAASSYILTYDDLLTLDGLQDMLKGAQSQKNPIEILSLSACETAAGNDRAPLGISGAAMKARAKSVLGTLWPVDDDAAVSVMSQFYRGIAQEGQSKARALQQAKLQLMRNPQLSHPFYWAPFELIGNWL